MVKLPLQSFWRILRNMGWNKFNSRPKLITPARDRQFRRNVKRKFTITSAQIKSHADAHCSIRRIQRHLNKNAKRSLEHCCYCKINVFFSGIKPLVCYSRQITNMDRGDRKMEANSVFRRDKVKPRWPWYFSALLALQRHS